MKYEDDEKRAMAEELIWSLLDEQISDEEFEQFQQLLASDDQARQLYVQSVQMHVDLHHLLGGHATPGLGQIPGSPGAPLDLPLLPDAGYLTELF